MLGPMETHAELARRRVERACRALEAELDRDVPLEDLARSVDLSPFHFHRTFRALAGETARAYVRRLRLERAARRIDAGGADLLDVALEAGFSSHEAFSRAFKRHFGVPPSRYRGGAAPGAPEPLAPIDVRIVSTPAQRVARVRRVGPYDGAGEAWAALMRWGWTRTLFRSPDTFALTYDDPEVTAPERLRYDACMVVSERARARGEVSVAELPRADFAVALHRGPYDGVGETHARMVARLLAGPVDGAGWQPAEPPAREVYVDDPRRTAAADLRTELWIPVEPAPVP